MMLSRPCSSASVAWVGRRSYRLGLTRGEWPRGSAVPASRRRRCQRATTANTMAIIARAMVVPVKMRLPVVLMGEIVLTPGRGSRQR
jgi:hypothetical protein